MADIGASAFALTAALQRHTDVRVEQSLLGLLLCRVEFLEHVVPDFSADALCAQGHADLYRAISAARESQARGPVLAAVCRVLNYDERERGYAAELINAVPSFLPDLAASWSSLLVELTRKRSLFEVIASLQADLDKPNAAPATALIARAQMQLDTVAAAKGTLRPLITMDAALDAALAAADRARANKGVIGLSTGMPRVDRVIGGLQPKTLTVLAGRPAMGKSALGMQWAVSAALAARDNPALGGVFVASLEMSADLIAQRVLAAYANVAAFRLRDGKHADYGYQLELARAELDQCPLLIDDEGSSTIAQIRLRAREAARRFGKLALLVIDHIHIVEPDERDMRSDNMTVALGRISAGCKKMAKEFDCPVVALAQLSRKLEEREDKRPILSDLRQAGSIEQDADTVVFVHRAEYYISENPPEQKAGEAPAAYQARVRAHDELKANVAGKAELLFEKVRGGRKSVVNLKFHEETVSFEEPQ